jgi:hypothetical protein
MAASAVRGRYCAACGQEAGHEGQSLERFGEAFCSERHAEQFTQAVQAEKVQAVARAAGHAGCGVAAGASAPAPRWRTALGRALCWGVPLLAIAVLLGGGGAGLGRASALIPVAAALACPLGMYVMMRAMSTMENSSRRDDGDRK